MHLDIDKAWHETETPKNWSTIYYIHFFTKNVSAYLYFCLPQIFQFILRQWRQQRLPCGEETVSFLEAAILLVSTKKSRSSVTADRKSTSPRNQIKGENRLCVSGILFFFVKQSSARWVEALSTFQLKKKKTETMQFFWDKLISSKLDAFTKFGKFKLFLWNNSNTWIGLLFCSGVTNCFLFWRIHSCFL